MVGREKKARVWEILGWGCQLRSPLLLRGLRGLGLGLVVLLALEGGHVVVIFVVVVLGAGEALASAELGEVEVAEIACSGIS